MSKVVFVIGNGFDIDLGLKTKYSDFAGSKFWKNLIADTFVYSQDLLAALEEAKRTETWFDIEKTMEHYARSLRVDTLTKEMTDRDKANFKSLSSALTEYLKDVQNNSRLNDNCYAKKVLSEVLSVGNYGCYTFNYTNLHKLANDLGLKVDMSKITHVHGSLERNSIILGVLTETDNHIPEEYSFLYKDNSRFYSSNNIYEDFEKSQDIVLFGHSINGMDFPYFKDFFIKQSVPSDAFKRKHITIFTYDDDSSLQIKNSIRNAGVNISQLYSRNTLNIIQTKQLYENDENELAKYNAFQNRMKSLRSSGTTATIKLRNNNL